MSILWAQFFYSWRDGENHLLFNMIAGEAPNYSSVIDLFIGKAMIAGADFNTFSYRVGYDISIPLFSPLAKQGILEDTSKQS